MDERELAEEVLALTLAMQEHAASDDERARLERLLADSEAARRWYIAIVDDTTTLRETASARLADTPQEDALSTSRQRWSEFPSPRKHLRHYRPSPLLLAIVASLLVVVCWWGWNSWSPSPEELRTGMPVARIISLSGVQWADGAPRRAEWSELTSGDRLRLDAGMVELSIGKAVQLVLEGPADFELMSSQKAIARRGKMVVRVGPDSTGFEVETPHANVVDLGTSFSINIDPRERTEVVVYEGAVDLAVRSQGRQSQSRRVATGEAVRVGWQGSVDRIVSVDDDDFLPPPQHGAVALNRPRIIRSVTDNISLNDTAKYYRIVSGGIKDDCRAYVDRLHEWNGIDTSGIPQFLASVDYVIPYNDDKILPNLQVTVELNEPAQLFVLWDSRVEVPDWLVADFVDTGWEIGLDEGFRVPEQFTNRSVDTGPGKSIDQIFSIWRREVSTADSVLLGPVRTQATTLKPLQVAASMYGIAAAPLANQWPPAE